MAGEEAVVLEQKVLEELRLAEQLLSALGRKSRRIEFWEALYAVREAPRTAKAATQGSARETEELMAGLETVREKFGRLAKDLRDYLRRLPDPPGPGQVELAFVCIMASDRARRHALKWLGSPEASMSEASLRIRALGSILDAYCQALGRVQSGIGEVPSDQTPRPTSLAVPPAPPPSTQVSTGVVNALCWVEGLRKIFEPTDLRVAVWEVFELLTIDSEDAVRRFRELQRLQREGQAGEFEGELLAFRQGVLGIRDRYGKLAEDLEGHLKALDRHGWNDRTGEIVVGLLMAYPAGRQRARHWLARRVASLNESAEWTDALIAKANRCLEAMKGRRGPDRAAV